VSPCHFNLFVCVTYYYFVFYVPSPVVIYYSFVSLLQNMSIPLYHSVKKNLRSILAISAICTWRFCPFISVAHRKILSHFALPELRRNSDGQRVGRNRHTSAAKVTHRTAARRPGSSGSGGGRRAYDTTAQPWTGARA